MSKDVSAFGEFGEPNLKIKIEVGGLPPECARKFRFMIPAEVQLVLPRQPGDKDKDRQKGTHETDGDPYKKRRTENGVASEGLGEGCRGFKRMYERPF